MTNPFAYDEVEPLMATIDALRATLVASWTRVLSGSHLASIVEMVVLCWLNMPADTTSTPKRQVQRGLQQVWHALVAIDIAARDSGPESGLDQLMVALQRKEPSLETLWSQSIAVAAAGQPARTNPDGFRAFLH